MWCLTLHLWQIGQIVSRNGGSTALNLVMTVRFIVWRIDDVGYSNQERQQWP